MKKIILFLFIPIIGLSQNDSIVRTDQSVLNIEVNESVQNQIDSNLILKNAIVGNQNNGTVKITCVGSINNYKEPLIIYNGKPISRQEMRAINPQTIKDIKVLKGENALALCGAAASAGVIIINGEVPIEYEFIVTDLGFESFLKQQPPARIYQLTYLKSKNRNFVSIWNAKVATGDTAIFDQMIEYNADTFYGLDFEYKLYQYFKYIEEKHSIALN